MSSELVQATMPEIAAVPHNGYYIVSTFSGCGTSFLYLNTDARLVLADNAVVALKKARQLAH